MSRGQECPHHTIIPTIIPRGVKPAEILGITARLKRLLKKSFPGEGRCLRS